MLLRGENEERPPLTTDECEIIDRQVVAFINDTNPDASLQCGGESIFQNLKFGFINDLKNIELNLFEREAHGFSH